MKTTVITEKMLRNFRDYMIEEEKSNHTVEKEYRDVRKFFLFAQGQTVTKQLVLGYKEELQKQYKPRSVNSMVASLNSFFTYMKWYDLKVKGMKLQRETFYPEKKELTRAEYEKLCEMCEKNGHQRTGLILQTIAGTGIRVSELRYITVQTCKNGAATVTNKGKSRVILIPKQLRKILLRYAAEQKIYKGPIFISKSGVPIDRVTVWRLLKNICLETGVRQEKVFPHNIRHLFARTFYSVSHDISKLADVLGHSSIDTTRLYIMTTEKEHRNILDKMHLIT